MITLLKNSIFSRILLSDSVSALGDAIFYIALYIMATNTSNPKLGIFLVSISAVIPNLFSFVAGVIADRSENKMQKIIVLAIIRSLLFVIIGIILIILGIYWHSFVTILVLYTLAATLGNMSDSLYTPLFPTIVSEDQIETANGLSVGLMQMVESLSKLLGAGIVVAIPLAHVSFLNAITFLISAMILFSVIKKIREPVVKRTDKMKLNLFQDLLQAYKIIRGTSLERSIFSFLFVNAVLDPLIPILLIWVTESETFVGGKAFTISLITALFTIGALLGNILGSLIFKRATLIKLATFNLLAAIVVIFFALFNQIFLVLLFQSISGFLTGAIVPKFSANVIKLTPSERLGTVSSALNALLFFDATISTILFTSAAQIIKLSGVLITILILAFLGILYGMKSRLTKS